jgi:PAS domain-containing protein
VGVLNAGDRSVDNAVVTKSGSQDNRTATSSGSAGADADLRRVLEAAGVGIATADAEGHLVSASAGFAARWGRDVDDLLGLHLVGLWPERRRAEITATLVRLVEGISGLETVEGPYDDEGRASFTIGRLADPAGRTASLVVVTTGDAGTPAADRRRAERHAAGEPGSTAADPGLRPALMRSTRSGAAVALLCCELDADDLCPRLVGAVMSRLAARLRTSDSLRAPAPGWFTVIAEDLHDEQDAAGVAYRLLSATVEPVRVDDRETALSMAIGVVVADGDASEEAMFSAAASALADARADGPGCFRLVDLRGRPST